MKVSLSLINAAFLGFLTASVSPVSAQFTSTPLRVAAADDTTAILNVVRSWGAVGDVLIVNNYATVRYFFGQNGGDVTFKRKNGKWNIVDGGRRQGNCSDVNCLVNKGVPRNIATQLRNYLEGSDNRRIRELNSFRQAWSKSNNTVDFLGYWINQDWPDTPEITIAIWPARVRNQVCVIGISEKSQYVKTGVISGNNLKIGNKTLTLHQNNENFVDFITSTDKKYFLINPYKPNMWYFNTSTKQKLRAAGCTASLPSR
ncbi:hypothetical protein ACQFX9_02610 [Aliinostoc sp. HNIBRCY26]|uniref:hypothetical protein n=1 Tax=Aliinostoc sp. HNIBRCY26 TaxID=3418997 RepID=UPI003D013B82